MPTSLPDPPERAAVADVRFTPVGAMLRPPDAARALQVADGVWQLGLPLPYPATKRVSAYLLARPEGWCLIDCGSSLGTGWEALEHALALAGVEVGALSLLVTTHQHADHAGLAATVLEQTGCEYAHLDARQALNERLRDFLVPIEERRRACHAQGVPEELVEVWATATVADDARHVVAQPDRRLHDGDVLSSAVGDWIVRPAPGHSASQLILFNGERRWLISADLVLRTPTPYFEWGHAPDPFGDHLASLALARELAPSLLLPGHGRPVPAAADQLGYATATAEAIPERVLQLLAAGEDVTPYDVSYRFVPHDADLDQRQAALSVVLAVLDHLERRGAVGSRVDDEGVRRLRLLRR